MDNYEISERFAEMWKQSRADAGKSQDYMARKLGVSKKTVQNWEAGTSSPSQILGFEWFQVLGLQPLPYYLQLLYPEDFKDISSKSSDEQIEAALIDIVKGASPDLKRKMLYVFYGEHGSSPVSVIEMLTAHLHTPLRDRLNIAESIRTNYEIAEAKDELVNPDNIPCNIERLSWAIDKARKAIVKAEKAYSKDLKEDA